MIVSALVLVWSRESPDQVGMVVLPDDEEARWFGRAEPDAQHLGLVRQDPGANSPAEAYAGSQMSREQLGLQLGHDGELVLRCTGRAQLRINGEPSHEASVKPGDVVEIVGEAMFLVQRRPRVLPAMGAAD